MSVAATAPSGSLEARGLATISMPSLLSYGLTGNSCVSKLFNNSCQVLSLADLLPAGSAHFRFSMVLLYYLRSRLSTACGGQLQWQPIQSPGPEENLGRYVDKISIYARLGTNSTC